MGDKFQELKEAHDSHMMAVGAQRERGKIVTWLLARASDYDAVLAAAIERGEHEGVEG